METIRTDSAHDRYYIFFKKSFPWDWGSYEKFVWKHLKDPFLSPKDFYVLEDGNKIESICVARKYMYLYRNKPYHILSMMDFATDPDFRLSGKVNTILQYIYRNVIFDYSIGFSSRHIRETVHKRTECVQTYYTYYLDPSNTPLSCIPCNDSIAIPALNSNINGFQILRDQKYIDYVKSNPDYRNPVFLKKASFVIGVAFDNNENSVRILEMSNYSLPYCMIAYKMASIFGKRVKIDFPQKINFGEFIKETCFDIFCPGSNYNIFQKGDLIWVPVCDRK